MSHYQIVKTKFSNYYVITLLVLVSAICDTLYIYSSDIVLSQFCDTDTYTKYFLDLEQIKYFFLQGALKLKL